MIATAGANALQEFVYEGQGVRVVTLDGEPWFVASDVCAVLEITNNRDAVARLDADEKGVATTDTPGGPQQMAVVNEAGLYALVLTSRKPEAKAFKRWIIHEVLPSIRRHGMYATEALLSDPEHLLRVTERLVEEHRARIAAEQEAAALAPPARAWQTLASAEGDYSLREAAQILSRDPAIETGQNRLAKWLRLTGWLDRRGIPYQEQIDNGRLAVRTRTYDHPHTGEPQITTQIRVTPKGITEIHKRMGGVEPLDLSTPLLRPVDGGESA